MIENIKKLQNTKLYY